MDIMKSYLELDRMKIALKHCKQSVRYKKLLKQAVNKALTISEEVGIDVNKLLKGE